MNGPAYLSEKTSQVFPHSLGIPREQMPQIKSDFVPDFIAELEAQGVKVHRGARHVGELHPTQRDVDQDKAREMLAALPERALAKPVIISRDSYLLDGHHRWAALFLKDPHSTIQVVQIDLPIRDLLAAAKGFGKVKYKAFGEAAMIRELNTKLEAVKVELGEKKVGIADLRFPSDCRQKDLVRAAEKDAEVRHGGNHDSVYVNGQMITQIPRHDPVPGTCRGIIKALKKAVGADESVEEAAGGKDPAAMTAGQINAELDKLDKARSQVNQEMIDAGRGHEKASETARKDDPLAARWNALASRQGALRNEIEMRYGPGAPSRLPTWKRGFGPRKGAATEWVDSKTAPSKLDSKPREKLNHDLVAGGCDGNGRFQSIGKALQVIGVALAKNGLEWDETLNANLFRGDQGVRSLRIAFSNPDDSFSPSSVHNSFIHFSWYKHDRDRYEVLAYAS